MKIEGNIVRPDYPGEVLAVVVKDGIVRPQTEEEKKNQCTTEEGAEMITIIRE